MAQDYQLDEVLFLKTLLGNKDEIKDITSLYTKIKNILKIDKIHIMNDNQGYEEKIVVVSNNLIEYKRLIIKEEGIEYLNYCDGKIFVTREEKENSELDKIKKI